jgi:hypothetical protein
MRELYRITRYTMTVLNDILSIFEDHTRDAQFIYPI